MAFKYMKRWSPSLLRKMQWKLFMLVPFLSRWTKIHNFGSNLQELQRGNKHLKLCKLPPTFMKDNTERRNYLSKLQKHSPLDHQYHLQKLSPHTGVIYTPELASAEALCSSISTWIKIACCCSAEWIKRTYSVTVGWFHNRQRKTTQL